MVEQLAAGVELVARRLELLLRDGQVECAWIRRLQVPEPAGHGGRDDGAADVSVAAQHLVHERLLVDRVAERVAEGRIPERRGRCAAALERLVGVEDHVRERVRLGGDARLADGDVRLSLE